MTGLIVFCAKYLFVLTPLLALAVFWKCSAANRKTMFVRGLIVLMVGVVLAKAGGALYFEPRPFVVHHVAPLIPHDANNGFPSDHTLLTFGVGFLLFPFSRRVAAIAVLVAATVGLARILCLLHSPLDIGASILMAAVGNLIAWQAVRRKESMVPASV